MLSTARKIFNVQITAEYAEDAEGTQSFISCFNFAFAAFFAVNLTKIGRGERDPLLCVRR